MTKTLRNGKKYTSNDGSPEEIYVLSSSTMESTQHDGLVQESNEESFVDNSEFERLSKLLRLPGDDDLWMPANADAGATAPMPTNYADAGATTPMPAKYADEAGNVPANNFPFSDLAPPEYDGCATPVTDKVQYPLMPAAWPGAATAEDSAVHAEIRNALNADINNYEIPQLGVYLLEESYGSLLDHDAQPREQDSMEVSEPDKGKDNYPLNEIYGTELTPKTKSLIDRLEDPEKKKGRKERKLHLMASNKLREWQERSDLSDPDNRKDLPDEPPSSPSDSSSSSSSDPSSDDSSDDSSTTKDTDEDTGKSYPLSEGESWFCRWEKSGLDPSLVWRNENGRRS
ncbi:hypothetical protein M407DRAFT_229285 [Tulasnella calospora MUT 4182]|uniref:Uncharacterized protein n=1 Tax=Tulasnella calospora MUT 4182 TaxID=1051891 RepID=A0A0C3Q3D6_9AGAM|nr:hypothetical protein M407DRAFT_229285 [Tulasnella calospora MUT 4182]